MFIFIFFNVTKLEISFSGEEYFFFNLAGKLESYNFFIFLSKILIILDNFFGSSSKLLKWSII